MRNIETLASSLEEDDVTEVITLNYHVAYVAGLNSSREDSTKDDEEEEPYNMRNELRRWPSSRKFAAWMMAKA